MEGRSRCRERDLLTDSSAWIAQDNWICQFRALFDFPAARLHPDGDSIPVSLIGHLQKPNADIVEAGNEFGAAHYFTVDTNGFAVHFKFDGDVA